MEEVREGSSFASESSMKAGEESRNEMRGVKMSAMMSETRSVMRVSVAVETIVDGADNAGAVVTGFVSVADAVGVEAFGVVSVVFVGVVGAVAVGVGDTGVGAVVAVGVVTVAIDVAVGIVSVVVVVVVSFSCVEDSAGVVPEED